MISGRIAVDVGSSAVRVAGRGRVVELAPGVDVLTGLVDDPGDVVPVGDPAVLVAGAGERVVVDAGHRATRVSHVRRGLVVARRTAPGGADLDAALARFLRCSALDAQRLREELSLHPTARGPDGGTVTVDEVRAALRAPLDGIVRAVVALAGVNLPVLLIGGGARSPWLAELLDLAGVADVVVARSPQTASVRAAAARFRGGGDPPAPRAARTWLPSPPVTRPRRRVLLMPTVALLVLGGLHLLGSAWTPPEPEPSPGAIVAQYGYRFDMPAGWAHTGGAPERRRSLLTPLTAPEGSDLIAVEATPLGYDSGAEPRRAAAELRAEFDAHAGVALTGYDPEVTVVGRSVTAYVERDGDHAVQWYVVLDGDAQLSVGCRHTAAGAAAMREACATVIATIESS